MKNKVLPNGIEIVSLAAGKCQAKVNLRAQIPSQEISEAAQKVLAAASSLWQYTKNTVQDNVPVMTQQAPVLNDERYVYPTFRALSQTHLTGRGLDFSTPGVLEAAVPLLQNKTVYPNHEFADIYNWLGVVEESFWDAAGEKSEGVPGINVKLKIDAYLNYRIACGVMMSPPAVNSMSLTVLFEFEYSHPQIAMDSQWKFFDLLGEEVDGHIVRLIVVRIIEIWEASLVYLGEDRLAKKIGDETDEVEDSFSAAGDPPPNSNEERTMKLTTEQKTKLGIGFDGEDVPETEIFKAADSLADKLAAVDTVNIAELTKRAEAGDKLVDEKRTEVTRLATLAELGSEAGELPPVIADSIKEAGVEKLQQLGEYYGGKAAEKFPNKGRSSQEDTDRVDSLSGDKKVTAVPDDGLFS